jgi:hypothetical protein
MFLTLKILSLEMNDVEKQKYETELHDLQKKHKDHEPVRFFNIKIIMFIYFFKC